MNKFLNFLQGVMLTLVLALVATPARADVAAFFTEVSTLIATITTNVSTVMIAALGIAAIFVGFMLARKALHMAR
jgi:hypothetical protein